MTLFILFLGIFAVEAQTPKTDIGTLHFIGEFKSIHVHSRPLSIWTPPNYSPLKRYPVIYVFDGQMLFDKRTTWNQQEWDIDSVLGRAILNGELSPCIVVGLYNIPKIRYREYFPAKPFSLIRRSLQDSAISVMGGIGPTSDQYLEYIIKEVKPYVDEEFMTLGDRNNTFIMGASMGGIMSMYALFEYPSIFSRAACLSSHFIGGYKANEEVPTSFAKYLEQCGIKPGFSRIYFDYGTETLDSQYDEAQKIIDAQMRALGWKAPYWETKKFEGAAHNEISWNARLMTPLTFLLNPDQL